MKKWLKYTVVLALAMLILTGRQTSAQANVSEDPEYAKYHQMSLMSGGSNWTIAESAEKLTHQERFDVKYQKIYGIDVSKWQGEIDWNKAKADGVEFAIVRLGFRSMAEGKLNLDEWFEKNVERADAAGVRVGIYFFTQAIDVKEAEEEAAFCISNLKKYKDKIHFPVLFDMEPCGGRLDAAELSVDEKTAMCQAFCKKIKAAGYTSGVYSSKYFFQTWYHTEKLEKDYFIWLAHYINSTDYEGIYQMWQFSSRGKIDGINGNVDLDVCYLPVTPDAPKNLKQTDLGQTSVSLSWSGVFGVDGYRVYVYDTDGNALSAHNTRYKNYVVEDLDPDQKYVIKVRSYFSFTAEGTKFSKESEGITVCTAPDRVTDIRTTDRKTNAVTVTWKKKKNALGYRVQLYDAGTGKYTNYATIKNAEECTVTGLKPTSAYRIRIRAYLILNSAVQYGEYSDEYNICTLPKIIKEVKVSDCSKNSITCSWTKLKQAAGYRVFLYDAAGRKVAGKYLTENSYTWSGLNAAATYYLKVQGYTVLSEGTRLFNPDYEQFAISTKPSEVRGLAVKKRTKKSITVTWKKTARVKGYQIRIYNSRNKLVSTGKTNQLAYTFRNLKRGKYTVKIRAYQNGNGKMLFSSKYTVLSVRTK